MKHKLKSLKDKKEKVCSATRIYFVDGKEFLKGMKHENMCFDIIPKYIKEEVEEKLYKKFDTKNSGRGRSGRCGRQ